MVQASSARIGHREFSGICRATHQGNPSATAILGKLLRQPDLCRIATSITLIHSLAVRALLDDLEQDSTEDLMVPYIHKSISGNRKFSQSQAEDLACRFSLLSNWTSLFPQQEEPDSTHGRAIYPVVKVHNDGPGLDLFTPRGRNWHPIPSGVGPGSPEYEHKPYPIPKALSLTKTRSLDINRQTRLYQLFRDNAPYIDYLWTIAV
ncbi:uncharacterized protein F4822DRAFT_58053 [Hypoxylon trugodes]|uniref:uncharacterized protein n=1 Tax=Hypoxylon trugodes TaxID=326681 RepID=UPI00218E2700|nr:uncharacterized protein F4822DRAFT_58053 [Hypoxylon trugodes]KAI1383989.1 hypothetical protein F4822DRAFT_58053 [Hypoxylon trugodes]